MKRLFATAFAVLILISTNQTSPADDDDKKSDVPAALNFKMKNIDGEDVLLNKYKGKVVLVVNVASKCGLTGQYEQLQALHDKYSEKGLSVIGFPCNQFLGQEPGTEKEIKAFCKTNYGVEFDMFSKVDVNDGKQCDFYKYLTALDTKPQGAGKISWNFEKFLINRKGEVVARFSPRTKPDSDDVVKLIEKELAVEVAKTENKK